MYPNPNKNLLHMIMLLGSFQMKHLCQVLHNIFQ